jgi:hypothetical protein
MHQQGKKKKGGSTATPILLVYLLMSMLLFKWVFESAYPFFFFFATFLSLLEGTKLEIGPTFITLLS